MSNEYVIKTTTHDIYFNQEHFFMLTERERKVLELRFSLYGNEKLSLVETGKLIESLHKNGKTISRERVRQIQSKALRKLRNPSRHIKVIVHS
jgi:RNA polymerase primary sigma factor